MSTNQLEQLQAKIAEIDMELAKESPELKLRGRVVLSGEDACEILRDIRSLLSACKELLLAVMR
jgi:hypothetical protein